VTPEVLEKFARTVQVKSPRPQIELAVRAVVAIEVTSVEPLPGWLMCTS